MLGDNLKNLRAKNNVSREQLAEALNVCRSVIGNWETGYRVPDLKKAREIADYFKITLSELLGEEADTEISPDLKNAERKLSQVSKADRKMLIDNFLNTIEIYLKAKN